MTTFLLIRHAHSPWSDDDDRPLSPAGRAAAAALADRLSDLAIETIYSSPYRRALETATPLATRRGLSVSTQPDLRERALGSLGEDSFEAAMAASWSDLDLSLPGGESGRDAQRRILALVRSLASRHLARTVALVSHGNLIALLLNAFDDRIGLAFWRSLALPDVVELRLPPSGGATFRHRPFDPISPRER